MGAGGDGTKQNTGGEILSILGGGSMCSRRRALIDLLSREPRSVSSLARELGMTRGDTEDDLRHAIRSARAQGLDVEVIPARCKTCDFLFGEEKLSKPGRCPACRGTRLFEPMLRLRVAEG